MLTYLLEKFDKIKRQRALYCSQVERGSHVHTTTTTTCDTLLYEFICKNTRGSIKK